MVPWRQSTDQRDDMTFSDNKKIDTCVHTSGTCKHIFNCLACHKSAKSVTTIKKCWQINFNSIIIITLANESLSRTPLCGNVEFMRYGRFTRRSGDWIYGPGVNDLENLKMTVLILVENNVCVQMCGAEYEWMNEYTHDKFIMWYCLVLFCSVCFVHGWM